MFIRICERCAGCACTRLNGPENFRKAGERARRTICQIQWKIGRSEAGQSQSAQFPCDFEESQLNRQKPFVITVYTHIPIHIHIRIRIGIHICIRIRIHINIIYTYTYTCIHTHTHIHTYIHTYIDT